MRKKVSDFVYILISGVLMLGVLYADIRLVHGYAIWFLYVLPLFAAFFSGQKKTLLILPAIATVLTVFSYFNHVPEISLRVALVNRTAGDVVLWITAGILYYIQRLNGQLSAQAMIAENTRNAVTRFDKSLRCSYANPAAASIAGMPTEDMIGKTLAELGSSAALVETINRTFSTGTQQIVETQHGGRYFETWVSPEFGRKGKVEAVLVISNDVTKLRTAEKEARYLSYHDKVTDLYNWSYFEEEMRRLDTPRELPLSIIYADINNLKLMNDVFGHDAGDRLLRLAADAMRESCREEDIIARVGGDEFAILLPRTCDRAAATIARRIQNICRRSRVNAITCGIAVGVETKRLMEQDVRVLLNSAEERMYKNKMLEAAENRQDVIEAMQRRVGRIDFDTQETIGRMKALAEKMGKALGLSTHQIDDLKLSVALHDIGKAAVPEAVMAKRGPLNELELNEMKKHAEAGYRVAHAFAELSRVADAVLYHHERWDGTGYPRGIKNDQIPLLARVLSIIDAYDAMTNVRAYHAPFTVGKAVEELKKGAGTQFDPDLVRVFVRLIESEIQVAV